MPVISRHIRTTLVPSGACGQKPPSLTYLASLAKYVPRPQTERPRVPDARGWKPCMGFVITESTASVPWNAQRVWTLGSKVMPWSSMDFRNASQLGFALPSSCWPFSTRSTLRMFAHVQSPGSVPQYIGGSRGCDLKMAATCSNSVLSGGTSKAFRSSRPFWPPETQKRFSSSGVRPSHCSAMSRRSVRRSRQDSSRQVSGPRRLNAASMSRGRHW
mmetsp:Transcript_79301/g.256762  ORF Transcript_79301/g.256762 Transcript_79301/m.256762 type:complete len:216 (-) Transcript_79301:843-1490(-)